MRGIRFTLIFIFLISSLSACFAAPDCFSKEMICVGLVTDTLGIEDDGMNQDAWAGLQNAKTNNTVHEIAYIESVDTRDYEKNISYFAERGYDMVITVGIGLEDETRAVAARYADAVFVGINQPAAEEQPTNLISITFAEDQMGFLAGLFAARISKTKIVSALCEDSGIESMWRTCEGFRAGVEFAENNVRAVIEYRDEGESEKLFLDESWGNKNAEDDIKRGADVIFAAGGITAQGALRAAIEARVKTIGAERNQAAVLSVSNAEVASSFYGNVQFEVEELTRLLARENLSALGPSRIKYLPLSQKFPESLTTELNTVLIKLWNGEIKTYVRATKP